MVLYRLLKTFKELNDAGIFDSMPNVFNLHDDETDKHFKYEEYFKNRGDKLWE